MDALVAWARATRRRSPGCATASTAPTTASGSCDGAPARPSHADRARGHLRALARPRPPARQRQERRPRGRGDADPPDPAMEEMARELEGHAPPRRRPRGARGAGRRRGHGGGRPRHARPEPRRARLPRGHDGARHGGRPARGLRASGSSTAAWRARATTSARSPSGSGTRSSRSGEAGGRPAVCPPRRDAVVDKCAATSALGASVVSMTNGSGMRASGWPGVATAVVRRRDRGDVDDGAGRRPLRRRHPQPERCERQLGALLRRRRAVRVPSPRSSWRGGGCGRGARARVRRGLRSSPPGGSGPHRRPLRGSP